MAESPKTYKTETGKILTDVDIEALADEAERGFDVEMLKERGRGPPMLGDAPSAVVPVRLDPELRRDVSSAAKPESREDR